MKLLSSARLSLTPEAFRWWGNLALGGALAFGLLVLLLLTWRAPDLLPGFALLLLAGAGAWYLFQRPLLNLLVLLAASVAISDYEAGIQLAEVLYGLYLAAFLAHWFLTRRFLYREQILHTAEEKALMLFLALAACSPALTFLFGGRFGGVMSEAFALSMLALYFPVKEACLRHRHGLLMILLVIGWIGLFTALRNFMHYQEILLKATQAWQVARGRVATNDSLVMAPSVVFLVVLIFARQWRHRAVLLGAFLTFFAGLLLTQSRGYWVAFLLGALVLFLLVDRRYKTRLVLLGLAGLASVLLIGFVFFGDYVTLIGASLLKRFASLGTAASRDLSLINRFYESKVVLGHILENPVLGYGMGVSYYFYDLTTDTTRVDTFIHNGYLALWYKFGVCGLALALFFWLRTAWRGVQAFRLREAPALPRVCGLAAAATLAAFTVSTLTSNPFYLNDTTFILGVLMGLAGGAYARATYRPRET